MLSVQTGAGHILGPAWVTWNIAGFSGETRKGLETSLESHLRFASVSQAFDYLDPQSEVNIFGPLNLEIRHQMLDDC